MGFLRRHPLIAACLALAAALVLVVGFETGWGTAVRPALPKPSGKPAAAADARVLPPLALAPADQAWPETAGRPLFIPTRRPVPAALSAGAGSMQKGTFVLQGVILAGGIRTALLREKSSGRIHRVQQGKDVNGMTVAQIEPDRVTLRLGEDQEEVVMVVQKGGGGGAPAAGPFPGAANAMPQGVPAGIPPANLPTSFAAPGVMVPPPAATEAPPAQAAPAVPAGAVASPQTNATGTMTAEELLARRRARRNQP